MPSFLTFQSGTAAAVAPQGSLAEARHDRIQVDNLYPVILNFSEGPLSQMT